MKLKKISCVLGLALVSISTFAQYEGTDTPTRVRMTVAPEDTTDVLGNIFSYQQDMQNKQYKDAYNGWKYLIDKAPLCITSIYKNGPLLLYKLIKEEPSLDQKKVYLNDLMHLYDVRLQNLAAINSFDKYPASEGDVLTYKAYWYYRCADGVDDNYNYNTIYKYYKDGITSVATMGGADVKPSVLNEFFTTSMKLYESGPEYYYDQFLNDYVTTSKACEKMMQNAKAEADTAKQHKMVSDYDKVLQNINYYFYNSDAANSDNLIKHYSEKLAVDSIQGDYEYLLNAISVLNRSNLTNNEAYYDACQYAYDIEPTYESSLGCAQKEQALGNTAEAKEYFDKALELTDDPQEKAQICAKIASSLASDGNITGAMEYANKIEEYDESSAGLAAWTRGQVYANDSQWDKAIESLRDAGVKDVTLTEEANRQIEKIQQYKSDVAAAKAQAERRAAQLAAAKQAAAQQAAAEKARRAAAAQASTKKQLSPAQLAAKAEYDRKMAEYKKKKAEYDRQKAAYEARKKADEDFWSQH